MVRSCQKRLIILVVVLETQVSNQIFAPQVAQSVLQLHQLNEDVMFRIQSWRGHRRLKIKRQPFLHTLHFGPLGKVKKQGEIQHNRGCQNRIAAEEIDLDLHLVAEPTEDVDI